LKSAFYDGPAVQSREFVMRYDTAIRVDLPGTDRRLRRSVRTGTSRHPVWGDSHAARDGCR